VEREQIETAPTFRSVFAAKAYHARRHSSSCRHFHANFAPLQKPRNHHLHLYCGILRHDSPRGPQRTRSQSQIRNLRLGVYYSIITTTAHVPSPCLSHFFRATFKPPRKVNTDQFHTRVTDFLTCASIARLLSTAPAVGRDSSVRLAAGILVQLSFVDSTVHA
jgi:hypothetical protein